MDTDKGALRQQDRSPEAAGVFVAFLQRSFTPPLASPSSAEPYVEASRSVPNSLPPPELSSLPVSSSRPCRLRLPRSPPFKSPPGSLFRVPTSMPRPDIHRLIRATYADMPAPILRMAQELLRLVCESSPFGREKIAGMLQKKGYVRKLLDVFRARAVEQPSSENLT